MAFALLARDPSPRALLDAANLGGDTDTIGAIAGAILGSVLGVEAFDTAMLTQVELTSHLDLPSIALELLALRAVSEPATSTPEAPIPGWDGSSSWGRSSWTSLCAATPFRGQEVTYGPSTRECT